MTSPPVTWSSDFEIGLAEIDAQHRRLFDLLARLQNWSDKGHGYAAALDTLNELVDYTKTHFVVEESLMRMFGYPDTERHVAEHEGLRAQLVEFQQRAMREDVSGELAGFIERWLVAHIDKSDRRYVRHFLEARIDPTARPPAKTK